MLQDDASLSNAELAERIGLSASQCSRRRAGLEEAGYIRAYRADLDARKLGYAIEAFTRVTLSSTQRQHGRGVRAFPRGARRGAAGALGGGRCRLPAAPARALAR